MEAQSTKLKSNVAAAASGMNTLPSLAACVARCGTPAAAPKLSGGSVGVSPAPLRVKTSLLCGGLTAHGHGPEV